MKPHKEIAPSQHSKALILPGCTELYQPNRFTYGNYKITRRGGSLTLIQSRILISLIKELQEAVLASMNKKPGNHFPELIPVDSQLVRIPIRLKEIAHPRQYKEVYEAAIQLGKASVHLPSSISKEFFCIATLFPRVEVPKNSNGYSIMYVDLFRDAARLLTQIDRTAKDRPGFFTKYLYEVAMNATNKYTYKLYMIISSWKQKGNFRMLLKDLRQQMGIDENEYREYHDFKKRVLLPVQKDLELKSDCWFNCKEKNFEVRDRYRRVTLLNFNIIKPAPIAALKEKIDYIKHLLQTYFSFSSSDIKSLESFFSQLVSLDKTVQILMKLQDLKIRIQQMKGTPDAIYNIPRYVSQSLLNLD